MSNKDGTSGQHISLPKGGGALQGIGEKFSPDLQTGTGNFSVPIALPPGRNGFQPQLSLAYSTGNGNGPFGLGWGLSVPGVARKTSHGIPVYDDSTDVFILSGSEDLVPIPVPGAPAGTTRYRPRTEGLFARIDHHRGDGDYWDVATRDGLVSRYGTERPTTPPSGWQDPAAVADPHWNLGSDAERRVFAWKLTHTEDPFGNRIEYRYKRDAVQVDGPHRWDQIYLDEIRYVDHGDPPRFLVHVRFDYEARPDAFSDYRAGFEIRTVMRCTGIRVSTQPDDDEIPVRSYRLGYFDEQGLPPEALPRNGVSLLSQVQVEGYDGVRPPEALPPLEFTYTAFEPERRRYRPITAPNGWVPEGSLGHPEYELADLFGDALPSVVQLNGRARYWRNRGNSRFDPPRLMTEAPATAHLADPGVRIADVNGDGRPDLLVTNGIQAGYYPLSQDGGWDRRGYVAYQQAPSFNLEDPEVQLVDLDGDGAVDALHSGTRLTVFFNDGRTRWERGKVPARRGGEVIPDVALSDPRVKLTDLNGDGLLDIAVVESGQVSYWPALGHGRWGPRITMRRSPRFGEFAFASGIGYDPRRVVIADVDGDGCGDLVYVGSGEITVWINQRGESWSEPVTVRGTPAITDFDAVRAADMDANGTSGILWTYDAGTQRESTYKFLDLTGGVKPYLLTVIDNLLGAVTRVEYVSSTRFYLEDERRPETRWRTSLPFPVQVVKKVEVIDALSQGKLTTEYRYHHGYWDGAEREFRGFGRVDQLDTETFADYHSAGLLGDGATFASVPPRSFSPPTETRTWFHQGPVGDEFGDWAEADYSSEYWSGDPSAIGRPAATAGWLQALPRRARRDALRALRGRVVRSELYARDDTERTGRPYTVTEQLHGVAPLPLDEPWVADPDAWRLQIFFPHLLAQRTTQWERGDDPMTQFSFTDDYDAFGQPQTQTAIAVPRGRDYRRAAAVADPYLATRTETTYARPPKTGPYIVDRIARTTSLEIGNDGRLALLELYAAINRGETQPTPKGIGQTLNFYDGPPFEGLAFGELGDHGALVRSDSLVMTRDILTAAYGTAVPPYLTTGATPKWTADYPAEFRSSLPAKAGYVYQPGGANSPYQQGYFAVTQRRRYDVHDSSGVGRGLLREVRDPLARPTTIGHDQFDFLPVLVTDAVDLMTKADYDYRVLQPSLVTDANNNRTRFAFTPLGLLASITVMGKEREVVGDFVGFDPQGQPIEVPSTRIEYDFGAFDDRGQPASARTIRHVHHAADISVPASERDETITTVEYSDGFGRLLQTRAQAEDVIFGDATACGSILGDAGLPRDQATDPGKAVGRRSTDPRGSVVVSGWQIYDNKGHVVERYEPFFAIGLDYVPPTAHDLGCLQKVTTFYDPRGQVVRTVNPDGSEQRIVRGVPGSIATPNLSAEAFEPNALTIPANMPVRIHLRNTGSAVHTFNIDTLNVHSGDVAPGTSGEITINALPGTHEYSCSIPGHAAAGMIGSLTIQEGSPGGTTERTIAMVDLAFEPTPWEIYTYDANDNAGRTHSNETETYKPHWNTPASATVDALGRTVETVQRNGPEVADWYRTRTVYDVRGNPLRITDALGRDALRTAVYDLMDRPLRTEQLDAGVSRMVLDAAGSPVEERDAKGTLVLRGYDTLGRSSRLWARDTAAGAVGLRERIDYGDGGSKAQKPEEREAARQANLLGRPWRHYDEAGLLTFDRYDFKDNLTENARQVVKDKPILDVYEKAKGNYWRIAVYRVNWTPLQGTSFPAHASAMLELARYETSLAYDALNRVASLRYPMDADGQRKLLRPSYNRGGALERVELDSAVYVERIAYNARGQRLLVVYGNRLMTRHAYDARTGRLVRLRSERYASPDDLTYRPDGNLLQDYAYGYDLVGNLIRLSDRTPGGGLPATPDRLDRDFEYDPLYRLRSATGRECDVPPPPAPWTDTPRCADLTRAQPYTEMYDYDPLGNLTRLQHQATGGFTRAYDLAPGSNRLAKLTVSTARNVFYTYTHDTAGNLTQEASNRFFAWDHADRMKAYRTQTREPGSKPADNRWSEPTVHAHYLYDAAGQRVKKLVRKQGGAIEVTVYVDGVFEHRRAGPGTGPRANSTLHVLDGKKRIAQIRVGPGLGDPRPAVTYEFADHLGSSNVVVDQSGALVNREEYTPYGETSFGSFARKRYRFTGKERDEESALYYHGARYYAPWLGRWSSCDPAGFIDGLNSYSYVRSNPVRYVDPAGMQAANVTNIEFTEADIAALPEAHIIRAGAVHNLEQQTSTGSNNGRHPSDNLSAATSRHDAPATQVEPSTRGGTATGLAQVEELIGNVAKGIEADRALPQRYRLEPARGFSTVTGIQDITAGRVKGNPPKPVGAPVIRVDRPHPGTPYPHLNLNPQLTGAPDPHTQISPKSLKVLSGTARTLEAVGRVARPVAIVTDAARLGQAFHADQGEIGRNTVTTAGNVAGGWAGAAGGAWLGAKVGAGIGGAIGSVIPGAGTVAGLAVGGLVGGIAGGVAGAFAGASIGEHFAGWLWD
jgi:RHS repeat-associated protein